MKENRKRWGWAAVAAAALIATAALGACTNSADSDDAVMSSDQQVTVTFDAGEGTLTEGENKKTVNKDAEVGTLPTPTPPTDKTFVGWFPQENGQGTRVTEKTTVSANVTFYAYYTSNDSAKQ